MTWGVGEGEDRSVIAEDGADARLEDGHLARRPESSTVHDGHAAMSRAAARDEPPHARVRLRGRHAVDVERVARWILAAFQLTQLATVDAISGIRVCASPRVRTTLCRRFRCRRSDTFVVDVGPHVNPVAASIGR